MTTKDDGAQAIFDRAGRDYARELAHTLAVAQMGCLVPSLERAAEDMASDIGLVLLGMDPPRVLDLDVRRQFAAQAIAEAGWKEGNPPEAPVEPKTYTLVASELSGYFALDTPNGRPLVRKDRIFVKVDDQTWLPATITERGAGRYTASPESDEDALFYLSTGMKVRMEAILCSLNQPRSSGQL